MTNLPRCAREGCSQPVYLGNALSLRSSIGTLIVYVCAEHFALYLQRPVALHVEVADLRATLAVLDEAEIVLAEVLDEGAMKQHTGLYQKDKWTIRFPVTSDEDQYAYHLCQWVKVRGLGEQQIHSRKIEDGQACYLLSPSFAWVTAAAIEKERSAP